MMTAMLIVTIVTAIATGIGAIATTLHWLKPRNQGTPNIDPRNLPKPYWTTDKPTIHSTSGTPSLQQLTEGMELDAEALGLAEALYELGLQQYGHPVNNRKGIIVEARRKTTELEPKLSQGERAIAEEVGVALATASDQNQQADAQTEYQKLAPNAQILAQHKRKEHEALKRIARDLEKDVPRTDYTSIRERISSGLTDLDSITNELPMPWQSIRTLNDKVKRPATAEKPPKPKRLHVEFCMSDGRILKDKHAEEDGDWLISHKYNFLTPCPPPTKILKLHHQGRAMPTGKTILMVDQEPTTDWETEFWRQRGYMDQTYLRGRTGTLPHQLRSEYRRQQIRKALWFLFITSVLVYATIFATQNL